MPQLGCVVLRAVLPLVFAFLSHPVPGVAQERVDRTHPTSANPYIKIYNLKGSVEVVGWDRDTISVSGTVSAKRSFFFGGDRDAAKLGVWTEDGSPASAHLEVKVPARSTVWVKTEGADMAVTGITGGIDVYSVTGRVEIGGSPRQLYAESMGGDLLISASTSSLRAKTASGSITLRGESEDVDLSTVAGDISVVIAAVTRGRFETVTGEIRFEGAVRKGGSLGFRSHSGGIELQLADEVEADFTVNTIKGDIRNELGGAQSAVYRDLRGRELSFVRGSGGADVSVQTFSGAIVLRAK